MARAWLGAVTGRLEQPAGATSPRVGRETASSDASHKRMRRLGAALIAVGVWGTLAPYAGPEVAVSSTVEFVDHAVPGGIVLAVALYSLQRGAFAFVPTAVALLAAFWMTVTHVPLVSDAARGATSWEGAIWMFAPSALLLLLTGLAFASAWAAFR